MSDRENSYSDRSAQPSREDRYYSERDRRYHEASDRHTYDGQQPPAENEVQDSYYASDAHLDASQPAYRDYVHYTKDRYQGESAEHTPTDTYHDDYSYRNDYSSHSHETQPNSDYSSARYDDSPSTRLLDDSTDDGVWMKESPDHHNYNYNYDDFRDVKRPGYSSMRTTVAGFAGVAAMLGLVAFLAIESIPSLSPGQIIAMDDYEGEQPVNTPFNLASLRNCEDDFTRCNDTMNANRATDSGTDAFSEIATSGSAPVQVVQNAAALTAIPASATSDYSTSEFIEVQEIPAATSYQSVSSNSYDSRGYNSNSYSSNSSYENNNFDSTTSNGTQTLQVSQQWSNVRSQPSTQGEILTSLAVGTPVSVINQTGSWFEISVDNGRRTVGFMHQSTVKAR